MRGESTESHRRHCFQSNNTTGGRARCVFGVSAQAFGESMKFEEPTSTMRFLVPPQRGKQKEHPYPCICVWHFLVTDKFSTRSLQNFLFAEALFLGR